MGIFLAVIITIIVILGLIAIFLYYVEPYIKEIISKAIDVTCYIDTYHYDKDVMEKIRIGQDRFFDALFIKDVQTQSKRDKTDLIFYELYTQFLHKLINIIPNEINMYNNRCLQEGEERKIEEFLDRYQKIQILSNNRYATDDEKYGRIDIKCSNEKKNSEE